ncbi:hypothetical protein VP01_1068g1 [Puccinia sorghi]|uniref:Uncharacterized protein n=1 Tax=Puccinia sorghi TaxID=27349 RepID=A0A0L6VTS1_9BASI|nr:hypothetical protein VP01_1068g1 [Puccinia sorghi]
MNHPLHEQELFHSRSSPNLNHQQYHKLLPIKPQTQTPLPIIGIPEPVQPPPLPNSKNSTIKQLSKAIQKSLNLNRLIKRKHINQTTTTNNNNNNTLPPHPPPPLQFSLSNSSSSQPPTWSAYQLDHLHPPSQSSYLVDNLSIGSLSHPDWNYSSDPRHSSGTSSGEFSWRIGHNYHHHDTNRSSSSPRSPSHSTNWFGRFTSRPRTMPAGMTASDQHPSISTLPDRHYSAYPRQLGHKSVSFSALFSAVRPSTGLRPVFGISVKEALQLSREDYHGIYGHAQLPTIIFKCGERLKCAEDLHGSYSRIRETP